MIMDLSGLLNTVAALTWSESAANDVAGTLSRSGDVTVDHDEAAGESWIRVLRGEVAVAYVHAERPFVMCAPEVEVLRRPDCPVLIVSGNLSEPRFSVQEDAFAQAFPDRRMSEVLRAPFSCDDLWFATV